MNAERPARAGEFIVRVLIVAAVAALALFVWAVVEVLLLLFAALLLAVLFRGMAQALRGVTGWPHGVTLGLVVLGLLAAFAGIGWIFGGRVAAEFAQLGQSIPELVRQARDQMQSVPWGRDILDHLQASGSATSGLLTRLWSTIGSTVGVLTDLVLVFFVALYLAAQPRHYAEGLLELAPPRRRPRVRQVFDALGHALWFWILGKLASMAVVGLLTTAGLFALGMPLAVALGLLAMVAELVPFFGPVLAAAPAVLLATTGDGPGPVAVLVLYLVIQQLESYLILPLIQKKAVSLPPVLTLAAILAFGVLFGPIGVLLAESLAVTGLILVKMLYVEDALGDSTEVPGRDAA